MQDKYWERLIASVNSKEPAPKPDPFDDETNKLIDKWFEDVEKNRRKN